MALLKKVADKFSRPLQKQQNQFGKTVSSPYSTGKTSTSVSKTVSTGNDEKIDNYDSWIDSLKSRYGLKRTTSINKKANETNFAQYAAALSDDVKKMIIDSFDTDTDYDLQAKIAAGLYATSGKNAIGNSDLKSSLRNMGFSVSTEYIKTSYIKDFKNHGGYLTNGGVTVITVKDPSTGAEIKIVDANGNGSVEVEEIFLNELLTGIAKDIDISTLNIPSGKVSSSGSTQSAESGSSGTSSASKDKDDKKTEENTAGNKTMITQSQYNALKVRLEEKYVEKLAKKASIDPNNADSDLYSAALMKAVRYLQDHYVVSKDAKAINLSKTVADIASGKA